MNSPPSSLASLLQYSSAQGQSQQQQSEEDGVAILTYLHEAAQLPSFTDQPEGEAPAADEGAPVAREVEGQVEASAMDAAAITAVAEAASAPPLNNGGAEYRLLPSKRSHNGSHATHRNEPLPVNAPAPSSPIDTSVTIPAALASLPPPPDARYLTPLSGLPAAGEEYTVPLSDRGEMGGKRRKPLHERAGWKEMEDGTHRDKRVRVAANGDSFPPAPDYGVTIDDVAAAAAVAAAAVTAPGPEGALEAASGYAQPAQSEAAPPAEQPHDAAIDPALMEAETTPLPTAPAPLTMAEATTTEVPSAEAAPADVPPAAPAPTEGSVVDTPNDTANAHVEAAIAATAASAAVEPSSTPEQAEQPPPPEDTPARGRGKVTSKESRAEQNRKAQQIFRRRREEKIKQLEADSAALVSTRARLQVAEARIEQLALDLEAKTIEAHALRTALHTVASGAAVSVVTPQNGLTITAAEFEGRDQDAVGEGEAGRTTLALDSLARASRELAKVNRVRRMENK